MDLSQSTVYNLLTAQDVVDLLCSSAGQHSTCCTPGPPRPFQQSCSSSCLDIRGQYVLSEGLWTEWQTGWGRKSVSSSRLLVLRHPSHGRLPPDGIQAINHCYFDPSEPDVFFFHSPSSPLTWTVISQLGYKDDVGDCVKTLVRVNVDSILWFLIIPRSSQAWFALCKSTVATCNFSLLCMSKNSFWKDLLLETKWVRMTCSFSVCLSWHFWIWVRQLSLTGSYQTVSWTHQSLSPHPPAPGSALCYLSSHWAAVWTPHFHDHHSQGLVTSPTSSSLFVSRTSRRTWYLVNIPNIYIKKLPLTNSRNLAHCLPPSVLPFQGGRQSLP